jgi:hypothetical protein
MILRILGLKAGCLCVAVVLSGGSACAQQSPDQNEATLAPAGGQQATAQSSQAQPVPASAPTAEKTEQEKEKEKEIEKQEQSQRALGIYPQFAVTSRQKVPPLSPGAKFHLFYKSAFDPFEFALAGLQSGIDQAENEFPEYGEGLKGFGKRYAADFGDGVSSGFWTDWFWPVMLKEDPRYFRLGHGRFIHRLGYGLAQSVVCRTDKGTQTFNFSNFLGAFSAGALSNTYHPQSDRGVGLTARGASFALMYGSLGQLLNEFWPDINSKIHRHHKTKDVPMEQPAATPSP